MTLSSLANGQRSLFDRDVRYPLTPPLTLGCPKTSTADVAYPVEVDYDYDRVPRELFDQRPGGLDQWAPLLPPLAAPGLGEGGTPLIQLEDGIFVKDESRNPTWSHKDRINRCTVSAATTIGAPGVVVASSGNHGASAAAFAARAGLPCVVLATADTPPAVGTFVSAYGAAVLPVAKEERRPLMRRIVDELGFHPLSNLTDTHTGHAYGPEGYKTIAYEIFTEIGVPAAVFVPTGYGEAFFGVWKGFAELRRLGLTDRTPRMFSCEPAAGAPLARAVAEGVPAVHLKAGPTSAYAIDCDFNGYRGVLAIKESGGAGLSLTDDEMRAAQHDLARAGLWYELSSAAGLAGLRRSGETFDGPVVCVATSSGFKDVGVGEHPLEAVDPSWESIRARLHAAGMPGA
ncbi:pyridoxal-phosphate dependent enzyme [Spirillospora sp. NPDC047279]|uniref:threonine synthase n=1 Tax=Spirillospora sp. NPDC047279 TaxID=3155478 RepID=UPI0033FADA6F